MMPGARGRIGICILNWNAGSVIAECLKSVRHNLENRPSELVVVDNASTDGSADLINREFPEITLIRSDSNVGYARGNNRGARILLSRGCDRLLFLNPDTTLNADTIEALEAAMTSNRRAGCVGGLPVGRTGPGASPCTSRPTWPQQLILYGPSHRFTWMRTLARADELFAENLSTDTVLYSVSGACLLFDAAAFSQIGGFDENTFLYSEEFIISERLISAGYQVVCTPRARYHHPGGHSTRQIALRQRLHFIRSEHYLVRRYFHWRPFAALALRCYRYLEFVMYAFYALARRRLLIGLQIERVTDAG